MIKLQLYERSKPIGDRTLRTFFPCRALYSSSSSSLCQNYRSWMTSWPRTLLHVADKMCLLELTAKIW